MIFSIDLRFENSYWTLFRATFMVFLIYQILEFLEYKWIRKTFQNPVQNLKESKEWNEHILELRIFQNSVSGFLQFTPRVLIRFDSCFILRDSYSIHILHLFCLDRFPNWCSASGLWLAETLKASISMVNNTIWLTTVAV